MRYLISRIEKYFCAAPFSYLTLRNVNTDCEIRSQAALTLCKKGFEWLISLPNRNYSGPCRVGIAHAIHDLAPFMKPAWAVPTPLISKT